MDALIVSIILKWMLQVIQNIRAWIGFNWLRIWSSGVLLRRRQWTLAFHKMQGIFYSLKYEKLSNDCIKNVFRVMGGGGDISESGHLENREGDRKINLLSGRRIMKMRVGWNLAEKSI
jgi:hypothetical protein